MDRLISIADLWDWLPTFRAVAEAESIRAASARLHVAASSVSRTLKLLEQSLGCELFHRTGRRLEINEQGRLLLGSVRDAMRGVDDTLQVVRGAHVGEVRVSTPGTIGSALVIPVLAACVAAEPTLIPRVEPASPTVIADLLCGQLDLACTTRLVAQRALRVTRLPDLTSSVYCGRGHPLWRRRVVTQAELLAHAFVAPPSSAEGIPVEGWPAQIPRRVGYVVSVLHHGLELCRAGHALGVFPDLLATTDLHRVPVDLVAASSVYVVSRRPLGEAGIVDRITAALVAEAGQLASRRRSS